MKFNKIDYFFVMIGLMDFFVCEGLVFFVEIEIDFFGWCLLLFVVCLVLGFVICNGMVEGNCYFYDFYSLIVVDFKCGKSMYWGFEGCEYIV